MAQVMVATTTRVSFPDLHAENQGMLDALGKVGINAQLVPWHDPGAQWANADLILVRTTWDYPDHIREFELWLSNLASTGVPILNPISVMSWNLRKTYLLELQAHGVPIVPINVVKSGASLLPVGYRRVVKPQIGVGSDGSFLIEAGMTAEIPFDAIVNPFLSKVADGERSVFLVSGEPICAFRKIPSNSDWRVQPQWGGRYEFEDAVSGDVLDAAMLAYAATDSIVGSNQLGYLRIDLLESDDGEWLVLEVEAIEPSFYTSVTMRVADAVAAKVAEVLGGRSGRPRRV